jgi:hypothetical protein
MKARVEVGQIRVWRDIPDYPGARVQNTFMVVDEEFKGGDDGEHVWRIRYADGRFSWYGSSTLLRDTVEIGEWAEPVRVQRTVVRSSHQGGNT